MSILISAIIPTIGRQTLKRAVESILEQGLADDEFEIIVVNDSGKPLQDEVWETSSCVKIIETNRRNRSVARNTGAAIAKGDFFHFLDDDDWVLPGAYNSLRSRIENNAHASWYHGGYHLVDNSGERLIEIVPVETGNCFIQMIAWEWLPLQCSFIRAADFFEVGGFDPLPVLEGGFEDIHLARKMASKFEFDFCERIIGVIRFGDLESTTDYVHMFVQNRRSREITLSQPGAFSRSVDSARKMIPQQDYWLGRVVYYYLGSFKRNMEERNFLTAGSRLLFVLMGILISLKYSLSKDFWRAVLKPHYNRVYLEIERLKLSPYNNTQWEL